MSSLIAATSPKLAWTLRPTTRSGPTPDSDSRQLAFLNGPPPKAVWLRLGNASTNEILGSLKGHQGALQVFIESEDEALLVIEPTSPDL